MIFKSTPQNSGQLIVEAVWLVIPPRSCCCACGGGGRLCVSRQSGRSYVIESEVAIAELSLKAFKAGGIRGLYHNRRMFFSLFQQFIEPLPRGSLVGKIG